MMKKFLVIIAISFLASGLILCTQTQRPNTPQYTADQVIEIAKAKCPLCFRMQQGERQVTSTSIDVRFIGGSRVAWEIKIIAPVGYIFTDFTAGTKILYFYEGDGSLRSEYYP